MKQVLFITLFILALEASALEATAQQLLEPTHRSRALEPEKPETNAINEEYANTFYEKCIRSQDPNVSASSQELMCTCMSAGLVEVMTMEDLDLMKDDSWMGQDAMHKMQKFVFGPCIEFPVRDYTYNECVMDRRLRKLTQKVVIDQGEVCSCTADRVAYEVSIDALDIIERGLSKDPTQIDTLALITKESKYENIYIEQKRQCRLYYQFKE